jgi:glucose-6-phosphate isomerase
MENIRLDYSKALGFIGEHEIDCIKSQIIDAHNKLHDKTGAGNAFLGWVDLPKN